MPSLQGEGDTIKPRWRIPELSVVAGGPVSEGRLWYLTALQIQYDWTLPQGLPRRFATRTSTGRFLGKLTWALSDAVRLRYSFVGDYELHTLRKFSPTGQLIASYGGAGTGPGEFNGVWGVSTDSQSRVYVADTFNKRVQVFLEDGTYVTSFGAEDDNEFGGIAGIDVADDGSIFVVDQVKRRIHKWQYQPEG